jgi:uncharacterized membrane protein YebE (DUF533 family)
MPSRRVAGFLSGLSRSLPRAYVPDMNIEDLLGAVTQSGLRSRTAGDRLGKSMGGWASSQGSSGAQGGRLGEILNEAGRVVGGNRNLASGGLGARAGALLGGRRGLGGALRGGLGGGVMALLGAMAYQALKSRAGQPGRVPLGLAAPQSEAEKAELARNSELVLKAMINAAKADGRVDEGEIRRILGKVQESGADAQALEHLSAELKKPMETEALVTAAKGNPELAVQLYSASLLAIEVDSPEEKRYLEGLATALGLEPEVTQRIHQELGLPPS